MRVRQILDSLTSEERRQLKKLLPTNPSVKCPVLETQRYPNAIVSVLGYDGMGELAEAMINLPSSRITLASLQKVLKLNSIDDVSINKILKSKTTLPFLECLKTVRLEIEEFDLDLVPETELKVGSVEGHPDLFHPTHVFEIKCTGKHKANWTDFLFQTFAYAALSEVTNLSIVLPLQNHVWTIDVSKWKKKNEYLNLLSSAADAFGGRAIDSLQGNMLTLTHPIGCHTSRPSLLMLPDRVPYQIYLASRESTKFNLKPEEKAAIRLRVDQGLKFFVHVPHNLNLSGISGDDDWISTSLKEHVKCSVEIGASGVVVHVGKATTQPINEAISKMQMRILKAMDAATPECPILIETPAGQGTELLTTMKDFVDFLLWFDDRRVRMCLDTCHVFSSNIDPLEYLSHVTELDPDIIRLVHYNDSKEPKGKRVDRHAFVGTGYIGYKAMKKIADFCVTSSYPMVIE